MSNKEIPNVEWPDMRELYDEGRKITILHVVTTQKGRYRMGFYPGIDTKVVQFYIDGQPYLAMGYHEGESFHNRISTSYLEKFGIHQEIEEVDEGIPLLEGDCYTICGAGFVEIIPELKFARFYGNSQGLDIAINTEHLKELSSINPDWDIFPEWEAKEGR